MLDGSRNTIVLFVTEIVMNCVVIWLCFWSGPWQEYVCVACYCNCNALRCDIVLLPFWPAGGIPLCCLLLQL